MSASDLAKLIEHWQHMICAIAHHANTFFIITLIDLAKAARSNIAVGDTSTARRVRVLAFLTYSNSQIRTLILTFSNISQKIPRLASTKLQHKTINTTQLTNTSAHPKRSHPPSANTSHTKLCKTKINEDTTTNIQQTHNSPARVLTQSTPNPLP